jgi:acyl-CoA thioester hydrolase
METYRGVVYPAQSDAMGHMTVQYYVAAFDQAMWHLVADLGYDPDWRLARQEGWADVRYEIDFRSELRVGDLFRVESCVVEAGNSSLKTHHRMLGPKNTVVAELAMTSVYFDLDQRKSLRLPENIRDGVTRSIAAMDSLGTDGTEPSAGLEK